MSRGIEDEVIEGKARNLGNDALAICCWRLGGFREDSNDHVTAIGKKNDAGVIGASADGTRFVNYPCAVRQQSRDTRLPDHGMIHELDDLVGTRTVYDLATVDL